MSYAYRKEDPELQVKLLHKYIKVELINKDSIMGFVHSIDPITHSMIISIPEKETYLTAIIPGHAICKVTVEEPSVNLRPPQKIPIKQSSSQDLVKRKKKLISWFESNLLPVSEVDGKIIIGDISLLPPYNVLDLCTENPIVAMEIRKIMEQMPEDFDL